MWSWRGWESFYMLKWIRKFEVHFCSSLSLVRRKKNILLVCALQLSPWLSFDIVSPDLIREGAGGSGSCLPRPLWGLNTTFESSLLLASQTKDKSVLTRTQPSSVKQFQLWPLVIFFFFFFFREREKVLVCAWECGYSHRAVSGHRFVTDAVSKWG